MYKIVLFVFCTIWCLWQNGSAWPEGSGHISSTSKIVDQANEPIEPEQMKCTCTNSESVMSANVSQCQPMSANVSMGVMSSWTFS